MAGRRILFVTWDGGGNVNPLLALGPRLAADGWDVDAYGPPSLAERFTAEGIGYAARTTDDPWDVTAMAGDVRDETLRIGADVVLADYMLPGALCGAEAAGRPTAALVHTLFRALLVDRAPGPIAMAASVEALNAARRALGLDEVAGFGDQLDRCARVLVTCPAELDVPAGDGDGDRTPLAANVRHVGPVLEPAGPDTGWTTGTEGGRPRVVVSLGTTPMDELPVLQRVLEALADQDVEVVTLLGGHLDPADIGPVPPNATVTGYVRHAAVLPGAALLVSHAGLGTVLAGLAHGLPLVCLPLGREQPDNAAAVERVGAGRSLAPDTPVDELRSAIGDVLARPGYRQASMALADAMARDPQRIDAELRALADQETVRETVQET
jgi:UDP:flavonoid glycosyltransferase YjiC (YdhE family)